MPSPAPGLLTGRQPPQPRRPGHPLADAETSHLLSSTPRRVTYFIRALVRHVSPSSSATTTLRIASLMDVLEHRGRGEPWPIQTSSARRASQGMIMPVALARHMPSRGSHESRHRCEPPGRPGRPHQLTKARLPILAHACPARLDGTRPAGQHASQNPQLLDPRSPQWAALVRPNPRPPHCCRAANLQQALRNASGRGPSAEPCRLCAAILPGALLPSSAIAPRHRRWPSWRRADAGDRRDGPPPRAGALWRGTDFFAKTSPAVGRGIDRRGFRWPVRTVLPLWQRFTKVLLPFGHTSAWLALRLPRTVSRC